MMRALFCLLSLSLSCYRPLTTISSLSARRPDETIVVGKIELIPPLAPGEQRLLPVSVKWLQNRVFLISSTRQEIAWSAQDLAPFAAARAVPVALGETFFLKAKKSPVHLSLGLVVTASIPSLHYAATGPGTQYYQSTIPLPAGIALEILPGDQAIYIGTLRYYRNDAGEILLVEVKDEYEGAQQEFGALFGGLSLRKALAPPPALDPKILAKYHQPPDPSPNEVRAKSSAGADPSAQEEAQAAEALAPPPTGQEARSRVPSPALLRLRESAGGGLWTYDAPLLTTPHPEVPGREDASGASEKGEILDLSGYYNKSPFLAFSLALGSSLAGYGLLGPSLLGKNNLATAISLGLLTIGPSAGHFYAGESSRALMLSTLRLVSGAASIIDIKRQGITDVNSVIFLSTLAVGVVDILDAPLAVRRRKLRMRKVRLVSVTPAPAASEEGGGGFVVQVGGEF